MSCPGIVSANTVWIAARSGPSLYDRGDNSLYLFYFAKWSKMVYGPGGVRCLEFWFKGVYSVLSSRKYCSACRRRHHSNDWRLNWVVFYKYVAHVFYCYRLSRFFMWQNSILLIYERTYVKAFMLISSGFWIRKQYRHPLTYALYPCMIQVYAFSIEMISVGVSSSSSATSSSSSGFGNVIRYIMYQPYFSSRRSIPVERSMSSFERVCLNRERSWLERMS